MNFSVRLAALADLDAVASVFDRYRQFQGQPPDLAAGRAFLQERFNHGDSVIFLAQQAGEPIGMAQLYPIHSSTALARVFILNDLFVLEEARHSGVASALLAAVEDHAWRHGACRISLNVLQSNGPAQALYRRQGWAQDGEFFMFHRWRPST